MIRKQRSWILNCIVGYFILASLCMFFSNTTFFTPYFWYVTIGFNILSLFFNFKIEKTDKELSYIAFAIIYKVFCLVYYTIGLATNNMSWMNENLFFICSICLSALFGMIIYRYKHETS